MKKLIKLFLPAFFMLTIILLTESVYASDNDYSLKGSISGSTSSGATTVDVNLNSSQPLYLVCARVAYLPNPFYEFRAYSKAQFDNFTSWDGNVGAYSWNCPKSFNSISDVSLKYYSITITDQFRKDYYNSVKKLINGDSSDFELHVVEGTIENPIEDEDIGTLILDKSVFYNETNGDDINDLYNLWSWKNKTSTGFSLSKNKYARTFIQVKVQSKCVLYSDLRHKKTKKNFDNYGEMGTLYDSLPYDKQPLKVSYLHDIPPKLPLTEKEAESNNPLYNGFNYTLYFRVVCTNDTAVIPSSTGKWYAGGWRSCDCNSDVLKSQADHTSNGHFDNNGNWVADEDDGHNNFTSGSDAVLDTDEAKDNFSEFTPKPETTTDSAISNLKGLMDMVGFIPPMIATLFSFLPPWCLTLISVTFASVLVLIAYKLIRG